MDVQKAIKAGLFVQYVYDNWNVTSKVTNLDGKPVVNAKGPIIPGKNYVVLKTIYANDLSDDISTGLQADVTIGIVAQNTADPTDIVIAIRGTENIWEWIQDAKFLLRTFPRVQGSGFTEDGFTDMYLSFYLTGGSSNTFMSDVVALFPKEGQVQVTVCGHSLGSALATLLALEMGANTKTPVVLYTFASPRVGDLFFGHLFNHVVPNAYRIANRCDVVTQLPTPPLYYHVGDDTELTPGKEIQKSLGCMHALETYFHMLDPVDYPVGADCVAED